MNSGMQFRDYVFPHNPERIVVGGGGATATLLCPGRGEVVQQLGPAARTVECTGCFFGGGFGQALEQLEAFRRAAGGGESGLLFLPGAAPFPAHLREFSYVAAGDGRVLPYRMVFVEEEAL